MPDLFLIDDDQSLTELLSKYLVGQGYSVRTSASGMKGLQEMFKQPADLVVLDVTMPEHDGWEILGRLRELSDVPVIMLTARDEERDVLRGFSTGADDYVTKPFSFAQLAARIHAVLLRAGKTDAESPTVLQQGVIKVDLNPRRVWREETHIPLTPTEFKLLSFLMQHNGEVVSPEAIVKEVWGPQYAGEVGHVRRYIWHLRHKLEPDPESPRFIHSERGFGYRFQAT